MEDDGSRSGGGEDRANQRRRCLRHRQGGRAVLSPSGRGVGGGVAAFSHGSGTGTRNIFKKRLLSPVRSGSELKLQFACWTPTRQTTTVSFACPRKIIHPRVNHEGNRYAVVSSPRPPRPSARQKSHRCLASPLVSPLPALLGIFWQFTSRAARSVVCRVFCVPSRPRRTPNFSPSLDPSSAATRSVRTRVYARGLRATRRPIFLDAPRLTCHCSTRR